MGKEKAKEGEWQRRKRKRREETSRGERRGGLVIAREKKDTR